MGNTKEIVLPPPTGIYSVGTQAIELKDHSRLMLRGQEARRWIIQAFYPAQEHGGPYPYMPGTLKEGLIQGKRILSWAQPNAIPLEQQEFLRLPFTFSINQVDKNTALRTIPGKTGK